jgi:hypothetical protein
VRVAMLLRMLVSVGRAGCRHIQRRAPSSRSVWMLA